MQNLSTKEVKARKVHDCDYCGLKIFSTEKYIRSVNIDGDISVWKSHKKCDHLTRAMDMFKHNPDGIDSTDFHNYISEAYIEYFVKLKVLPGVIYQLHYVKWPQKLKFVNRLYPIT